MRVITMIQISRFGPFPRNGLALLLPPSFSLPFYRLPGPVPPLALFQVCENGVSRALLMLSSRVRHTVGFTVIIFNSQHTQEITEITQNYTHP